MRTRIQLIAPGAIAVAALMVLVETLYFASVRPGYSHISNTISELGETGSPYAGAVSFGFFLPVGLLVWLALGLVVRNAPDHYASLALIALSGLGFGYVIAAFFPCDPGGPLFGSWRTLVHNVAGVIDYEGTGLGFLFIARHYARNDDEFKTAVFSFAGVLLLLVTAYFSLGAALYVRGAIQRIAEGVQFLGVFFVCYVLSRQPAEPRTPAHCRFGKGG